MRVAGQLIFIKPVLKLWDYELDGHCLTAGA